MSIFHQALKQKLRFQFKGSLSVEDLFDLDVKDLDAIYKKLAADRRAQSEDSLLDSTAENKASRTLALQIDIVKAIVEEKLAEADARKTAADKRDKKKLLAGIIARKQVEDLEGKTVEDLQKMIDEL